MPAMRILLHPNPTRDIGLNVTRRACGILAQSGAALYADAQFISQLDANDILPYDKKAGLAGQIDMIITFGGDGTLLGLAAPAAAAGVPLLGVNLGRLGFLTGLSPADLPKLRLLADGRYIIEPRMMLDVSLVRNGTAVYTGCALNEAIAARDGIPHAVTYNLRIDGEPLRDILGDGIIVSTPTGSTAYSYSAGGPVIDDTADCILITPVCAHAHNAKPLVLAPNRNVEITIGGRQQHEAVLCLDGSPPVPLYDGDTVCLRRSAARTLLVRFDGGTVNNLKIKLE